MSVMKAAAAPMPMPALAPVLSGVASALGTKGTGALLEVALALAGRVLVEVAVRLTALEADEDADRVEVMMVVDEEGACGVSCQLGCTCIWRGYIGWPLTLRIWKA